MKRHRWSACCLALFCAVGIGVSGQTPSENKLVIHADREVARIAPEIYGHFAEHLGRCIYDGFFVGEDSSIPNLDGVREDVIQALLKIKIPVLRWPGGCFADEYHWREGIGPKDQRPPMLNTHWGMVTEDNSFGTHEFLNLCELLGAEAYVAGNVGSGTVEEMQDWVEYMTFAGDSEMGLLRKANGREKPWRVKYFGVGNENWGCGGNMTAAYYADLYKRFQTYVRSYSGNRIVKVACGPGGDDADWMETVMKEAGSRMDAVSMHYYVMTGSWGRKGHATEFDEGDWFELMKRTRGVHDLIEKYSAIMDRYDRRKRVGLYVDEWGTWWDPAEGSQSGFLVQQNTLRDAVSAGIFLNAFNQHSDRVRMANIAQTINVLQAMIMTEGEKMIVTPTYHVFDLYQIHQGARKLDTELTSALYKMGDAELPALDVSVSKGAEGQIYLTICNLDPQNDQTLSCEFKNFEPKEVSGRVLTASAMNAHNTFDQPESVTPKPLTGGQINGSIVTLQAPSKSVMAITIR